MQFRAIGGRHGPDVTTIEDRLVIYLVVVYLVNAKSRIGRRRPWWVETRGVMNWVNASKRI